MKYTYFININSLEELRKQYKTLLKVYHPDNKSGSDEICKVINKEYEALFSCLKSGQKANNQAYGSMKWDETEDATLREKLSHIIHFNDINIMIGGNWIWIDGNTYQYKDELKARGFRWAREKKKWYWHSEAFRKRSRKNISFDQICGYYGVSGIEIEKTAVIA